MGAFRAFVFLALASWLGCGSAFAEKRVALVIGNSAYQKVAKLPNPANDAAAVAAMLKAAGFDSVESKANLSAVDLRKALRDFGSKARDADMAVVYYAGHGIELDGTNYLIPVDAALETDADVLDETLPLDRVLFAVEPAKQLRLVILDACRDNPFAKTMKRTVASRAIGQGLAKLEPTRPNMLIAYSAKAGSTALDGDAKNSPFTMALAKHLTTPGPDLRRAFGFVRDEVLKTTSYRQEPFVYGSLGGDDVPLVPAKVTASPANPQADIRRDYELAQQIGNEAALNAFLAQYPDGFYAELARSQLAKIAAEDARVAATEKARLAEQERARRVAEGAQKGQQAKADADAKAAEQARIAAEKAKQVAQEQVAAAEQKRTAIETSAAGKAPEHKASENKVVADNKAADQVAVGPPAAGKIQPANVAALSDGSAPADIAKSVQIELRRVGCLTAAADGEWNSASQRSLALFNRHAGTRLNVKLASTDALDAIKLKPSRVCPLVCEHGFKPDGDRCSRIVCAEGSILNDDNECEKRGKKPVAKRDRDDRERAAPLRPHAKQVIVGRSQAPTSASTARPLTGQEREEGCNSYGAIMSGKCP